MQAKSIGGKLQEKCDLLLTMCLTPSVAESSKIVFISRPCLKPHVTWKAVTQLFT